MSALQPQSTPPPAHRRTLRQLLSHIATPTHPFDKVLGPAALDASLHDFSWRAPQPLPSHPRPPQSTSHPPEPAPFPIFARVSTDDFFRLSLQSCVTHRGLPLLVSPSSLVDLFDKLVWIDKWRFIPSLGGWNICADASHITAFPSPAPPRPPPNPKRSTVHLSALVRACSQIIFSDTTSTSFLVELTYLDCDRATSASKHRLRPVDRQSDACIVLCIGPAAKWWPRMRQGDHVLITALKPMKTRAKYYVLQTTAESTLTTDMRDSAPPAKRQRRAVGAPVAASLGELRAARITRKLFEVISYEGIVTRASRREVVLDGIMTLSLSRQLGASLHLFQIGNRLNFSFVLAVPGSHSQVAIIPTMRTLVTLLHVGDGSQNAGLDNLAASENQSLPNERGRDRLTLTYWHSCLSKKLQQLFSSIKSERSDSHASYPCGLDLLFTGRDGSSGVLKLLHNLYRPRDPNETFVDILIHFVNPISSFEGAIPFSIPNFREVCDLCLKACRDVCTDRAGCIELFQGFSSGALSSSQKFRFRWTDMSVPTSFFSPHSECLLIGLLRCTKYTNVYSLSDDSGAYSLRCYDSVPFKCIGAIVALQRYRIITNSWKRDLLIICKAEDIQVLVNGPNLASHEKKENSHSVLISLKEASNLRKEFRVSRCLRKLETVTQDSCITEQTSLACMVAQKVFSRESQTFVIALGVAKKPKGEPWLYCAEEARREKIGVVFSDSFSARLAGMLSSGDVFLVSYVCMKEQDPTGAVGRQRWDGEGAPEVMWKLNGKYPLVKVVDDQKGAEELVPDWLLNRIRSDSDLESLVALYRERRVGIMCDPMWMAYDTVETAGSDVLSMAGTVEGVVSENQYHGPILQLRDRVLGLVGVEIVLSGSTSLAGVSRGLQVKAVGVRRMGPHGAGSSFKGTDETRIEVLEVEGRDECQRDGVVTMESVGKWFPYSCFPGGGVEQQRNSFPRIAIVRYRQVVGFKEAEMRGDSGLGSWYETQESSTQQADMIMRVDDGSTEFDLVIGAQGAESGDEMDTDRRGQPSGGAHVRQGGGHKSDTTPCVEAGPVSVLYQVCGDRDDEGMLCEEPIGGPFRCVPLRPRVNLWTCVARPRLQGRQLFREPDARGSRLAVARSIACLLEKDE